MWWLAACRDPEGPRPAPPELVLPSGLVFEGEPPRNLLFLSLDTTRADHLGRYDTEGRGLTPALDAWMAESVVLDDVLECSNWTVASATCLLSGASLADRAPALGMVPILVPGNAVLAPVPDAPQLSHWLAAAGYDTGLVTANDWFGERHGAAQGYARYAADSGATVIRVYEALQEGLAADPLRSPWYLHLHFFEPHQPYTPPPEFLALDGVPEASVPLDSGPAQKRAIATLHDLEPADQDAVRAQLRARYEGELRFVDAELEALRAALDADGLLDDTLVVFATDHGEALWENGYLGHAAALPPAESRAVVFFWAKNLVPDVIHEPRAAVDVVPTVLSALGLPIPPEVTGVPLSVHAPARVRTAFADAFGGPVHAVRKGRLMLQFAWLAERPVTLWDVVADPLAVDDRYDPERPSPEARELWRLLEPEVRALAPYLSEDPRTAGGPPWPPELSTDPSP